MARNGSVGVCPHGGVDWPGEWCGGGAASRLSGDGLGEARRVELRPAEAGQTDPRNSRKPLFFIDL